jgi:hypothetical protein
MSNGRKPLGRRRALATLALAMAAAACGPGVALSPAEIKNHGIVVLRAPPDKAFQASVEALKTLGYEIAVESADKGLIVTKRKGLPDLSAVNPNGGPFSRQYTIEIRDAGGSSRITATPAIFENETDISGKKVWDIDGPVGEHELWKQLFAKIEQRL